MKFGVKNLITILIIALSAIGVSIAGIMIVKNLNKSNNSKPQLEVSAWSGSGTSSSPYLINSISDMDTLSSNIAGGNNYYGVYFKLTTDLDYSSVSNFVPIGAKFDNNNSIQTYDGFCGIFDGDGHIISNLTTTVNYSDGFNTYVGFFAALGSYNHPYYDDPDMKSSYTYDTIRRLTIVKDLKIQNFNITCQNGALIIGGIAGVSICYNNSTTYGGTNWIYSYSTLIDGCIVEEMNVNCGSNYVHVSGLVGCNWTVEGYSTNSYSSYNSLGYDEGSLNINNCMVVQFGVENYTYTNKETGKKIKGVMTVIGPSYTHFGTQYNGINHIYFYRITNCVTDTSSYYTINGDPSGIEYLEHIIATCSTPEVWYDGKTLNVTTSANSYVSSLAHNFSDGYYNFWNDAESESLLTDYGSYLAEDGKLVASFEYDKNAVWYINDDFVYLQKFLIQAEYGVNNTSYGTILVNTNYLGSVVPRKCYNSTTGSVLHVFMFYQAITFNSTTNLSTSNSLKNGYNLSAQANTSYRFDRWEISETSEKASYIAYFVPTTVYYNLTLKGATGTSKTTDSYYSIASTNNSVKVTMTTTLLKSGAYTCVKFEFYAGGQKQTVEYNLTDNSQYISSLKKNSSTYSSSQTFAITEATTFEVLLSPRSYNATFG